MRMMHRVGALSAAKEGRPYYELSYTGAHTVEEVVHNGILWEQWTFTSSGILSVLEGTVPPSEVWMCGGGTCGMRGSSSDGTNRAGGFGAYAKSGKDIAIAATMPITIGAGATTIGALSGSTAFAGITAPGAMMHTNVDLRDGGTGGGSTVRGGNPPKGDGIAKYPHDDTEYFAGRPHCPGGGAGAIWDYPNAYTSGGNGGTNGGDGGIGIPATSSGARGGDGGAFGGGRGGGREIASDTSTAATFYGGGGGGKSWVYDGTTLNNNLGYRPGYQGVVYLRIPLGRAA